MTYQTFTGGDEALHVRAQRAKVGCAALDVDARAVVLAVQLGDARAEFAQCVGRDRVRGSECRVDDDMKPFEIGVGVLEQAIVVANEILREACDPDARARRSREAGIVNERFDLFFHRVGEFETVTHATAGVGTIPIETASRPTDVMPATIAASSIVPDSRVSLPTMIGRCRSLLRASTLAPARPMRNASSGVSSAFATPRTPSVPNNVIATPAAR